MSSEFSSTDPHWTRHTSRRKQDYWCGWLRKNKTTLDKLHLNAPPPKKKKKNFPKAPFSIPADLQIALSGPARRRANSVCRLLKAIRAGPGFSAGVLKVTGRMLALCDVDVARSPALSLCKYVVV